MRRGPIVCLKQNWQRAKHALDCIDESCRLDLKIFTAKRLLDVQSTADREPDLLTDKGHRRMKIGLLK